MIKFFITIGLGCVFCILICFCSVNKKQTDSPFLNARDSVAYVGMQTCRSCHSDKYNTYIHTGMGHSFGPGTLTRTDAKFDEHALVYDSYKDLYYKPFIKDSLLYVKEYRLKGKDTIHTRTELISYIIGSGHHTNSHIISNNGYIYQAPVTFYTQEGKWDLAPGFEKGMNSRFSRLLSSECITCHNHYPDYVKGSENRFSKMPLGIECERCHGPGALHVKKMLAGETVDTSKVTDYTIVNPKRLSRELVMDICQRCHLQGISVLNEGKTYYDFKPGNKLSDVMNIFLPRYSDSDQHFIMASQADRLKLSSCYQASNMSCITCHNPHVSVKAQSKAYFNFSCKNCHKNAPNSGCTVAKEEFNKENGNCVNCHMPRSGSIDIPHISITDHNIRKSTALHGKAKTVTNSSAKKFFGLQILTKPKATELEMAKAYIAVYDKFIPDRLMLDSAEWYLNNSKEDKKKTFSTSIYLAFTRENYKKVIQLAEGNNQNLIADGWTAYRVGEAYFKTSNFGKAKQYFDLAVKYEPYSLDFLEKQAKAYIQLKLYEQASLILQKVLSLDPKRPEALTNLGIINAISKNYSKAQFYYDKALKLDPDYVSALLNNVALNLTLGKKKEAKNLLERVLKVEPDNDKAQLVYNSLNSI